MESAEEGEYLTFDRFTVPVKTPELNSKPDHFQLAECVILRDLKEASQATAATSEPTQPQVKWNDFHAVLQ